MINHGTRGTRFSEKNTLTLQDSNSKQREADIKRAEMEVGPQHGPWANF